MHEQQKQRRARTRLPAAEDGMENYEALLVRLASGDASEQPENSGAERNQGILQGALNGVSHAILIVRGRDRPAVAARELL